MKSKIFTKEEHKKTFPRSIFLSVVITLLVFVSGMFFVDYLEITFFQYALGMIPITFFMRYFGNKYWVFRSGD